MRTIKLCGLLLALLPILFSPLYGQEPITATAAVTDVSCYGGSDGAIDITPSGGTAPYTYAWDYGPTSEDLTNLAGGTYTVTVTDAASSSESFVFSVAEPEPLELYVDAPPNFSCDPARGYAEAIVSGGSYPYSYQWFDEAGNELWSSDPFIDFIFPGIYTVVVTDARGCSLSQNFFTEWYEMAPVTDLSSTNPSCSENSDGSITGSATFFIEPTYMYGTYYHYRVVWLKNDAEIDSYILEGDASFHELTIDLNKENLSAGKYTIIIEDNIRGCYVYKEHYLTDPVISLSAAITDETCLASDGAIDLSVSGGAAPYTFAWDNGATTEDLSGLAAGSYSVIVTDANGCATSETFTVGQQASDLAASVSATDVSCAAAADGSIDMAVSGGTAPFTYSWSNGATTEDITSLAAGTYEVTITDANGCTATVSTIISEPTALTVNASITDATCTALNGSIDLSVSGGTAPYTFSWSNGATTGDLSDLGAGEYNVTVTDASGCATSKRISVGQQTGDLSASIAETDVSCAGASDGRIDLAVNGGTAPFTFNWSNSATTEDISGLAAGTYEVTITDANGCTATASTVVSEPTALSVNASTTDATCTASNGGIDLSISGGTAPYTFAWDNGATTEDLSGLAAGEYNVTVTDAGGCSVNGSFTVGQQTSDLVASVSATDVSCAGAADGSIDLTVSGGTAPFNYNWNNGSTTEDITGLAAGSYEVTITDVNGCTATASASVSEPTALSVNASTTDATCTTSNGSIDLSVSGGTAPYTFAWDNEATSEDLSDLGAGEYNVTITDAGGCATSKTFTVGQQTSNLAASVSSMDVSCADAADGSINLTVSGGTAPFTYNWSNSATTEDITGLAAGGYEVTVTDANGCTATVAAAVTEPDALNLTYTSTDVVSGGDGSIDLSISGGTAPYTFNWNAGFSTSEDLNELEAGSYTVEVTDAQNCTVSEIIIIAKPNGIEEELSAAIALVPNPASGTAFLLMEKVNHPYYKVRISTVQGNILKQMELKHEDKIALDISELKSGLYFIRVEAAGKISVRRLIVR